MLHYRAVMERHIGTEEDIQREQEREDSQRRREMA
jgi:hypothetical protein